MEALELYTEETQKRKEIEAEENKTGKKVSGRINFRCFVFFRIGSEIDVIENK